MPSKPRRIISGLKKTFIKITYIFERTNNAEIRREEPEMRKRRVAGRIYGTKYSWKGYKDRNRQKNRINRNGQAMMVHVKNRNRNIPTTWRWSRGDRREKVSLHSTWLFARAVSECMGDAIFCLACLKSAGLYWVISLFRTLAHSTVPCNCLIKVRGQKTCQ